MHRPLPPSGTDKESHRHQGQKTRTLIYTGIFLLVCIFLFSVRLLLQFIVKGSVEESMVKIQRQKQDLVEKAFGSTNTDRKTTRIEDIKALMEL